MDLDIIAISFFLAFLLFKWIRSAKKIKLLIGEDLSYTHSNKEHIH